MPASSLRQVGTLTAVRLIAFAVVLPLTAHWCKQLFTKLVSPTIPFRDDL